MAAVVINDFEVIPEPPPSSKNGPAPSKPAPPRELNPLELERLLRREAERALRIWAH